MIPSLSFNVFSKADDDGETRAWRKQLSKWILKLENFDSGINRLASKRLQRILKVV